MINDSLNVGGSESVARINIQPRRLPVVMAEAERIARLLKEREVDLNEAAKAIQVYAYHEMDRNLFERYLDQMAKNPPPRSRRTQNYYQSLSEIWQSSDRLLINRTRLNDAEKMYAWSWAIRLARGNQSARTTQANS